MLSAGQGLSQYYGCNLIDLLPLSSPHFFSCIPQQAGRDPKWVQFVAYFPLRSHTGHHGDV